MDLGQSFKDNLKQAEEWVRRLRRWADRVESHPKMLALISVLKYIPSNGAQAARRKLESLLEEEPRFQEEIKVEGESENSDEDYNFSLSTNRAELKVTTKKTHSIEIFADDQSVEIMHGDDPSNIFYPRMKERVSKTFGLEWSDRKVEILTEQAIHQLFKSELDRARSTLRWAVQEHQKIDY